jgi:hypothetical protein
MDAPVDLTVLRKEIRSRFEQLARLSEFEAKHRAFLLNSEPSYFLGPNGALFFFPDRRDALLEYFGGDNWTIHNNTVEKLIDGVQVRILAETNGEERP